MNFAALLPRQFRPNRRAEPAVSGADGGRPALDDCRAELRAAAEVNLDALLDGKPPVAAMGPAWLSLVPGAPDQDPLAGYSLPDYRSGTLPGPAFADKIMSRPGLMALVAHPSTAIGSGLLLTGVMSDTFSDGALRHQLADRCRRFLCDHVLFHPGPPPAPLFSPAGLAVLIWSQPAQVLALPPHARDLPASCLAQLSAGQEGFSLWDQWLFRRIAGAPGWILPEALASLPWVAWRPGDPAAASHPDQPASWSNLLCLEP